MRKFVYFYCVLIIAIFVNTVSSRYIKRDDEDNLDLVEETTESVTIIDEKPPQSREEFIQSIIDQINQLILDNLDTYDDPERLKEIFSNRNRKGKEEDVEEDEDLEEDEDVEDDEEVKEEDEKEY